MLVTESLLGASLPVTLLLADALLEVPSGNSPLETWLLDSGSVDARALLDSPRVSELGLSELTPPRDVEPGREDESPSPASNVGVVDSLEGSLVSLRLASGVAASGVTLDAELGLAGVPLASLSGVVTDESTVDVSPTDASAPASRIDVAPVALGSSWSAS